MSLRVRTWSLIGGVALVAGGLAAGHVATARAAGPPTVCSGGSVASGTYASLEIAGFCAIDSGPVTVAGNLTVDPGAGLNAAFGGSDLTVGGNLTVGSKGILVLGCEPEAFSCFNQDPNGPPLSTHDVVSGNLSADQALMMLVHNNHIGRNMTQTGGGGGVTCGVFPLGPDGPPAYSTYEDNVVGGNATVNGLQTCWFGFIRNSVANNVSLSDDVNADRDGNEVVTNSIAHNLNCSGDSPAPQVGDSQGGVNTVGGRATGQCAGLVG